MHDAELCLQLHGCGRWTSLEVQWTIALQGAFDGFSTGSLVCKNLLEKFQYPHIIQLIVPASILSTVTASLITDTTGVKLLALTSDTKHFVQATSCKQWWKIKGSMTNISLFVDQTKGMKTKMIRQMTWKLKLRGMNECLIATWSWTWAINVTRCSSAALKGAENQHQRCDGVHIFKHVRSTRMSAWGKPSDSTQTLHKNNTAHDGSGSLHR